MKYIIFDDSLEPSCAKCRFRNGEICVATGEKRLYQICPIRTLPSKRKNPITKTFGTPFNKGQVKGWNDCIEEIEK